MKKYLDQDYLEAAQALYSTEDLRDIHNRLFVELAVLLDGRKPASVLTRKQVRLEEMAIVFERHEVERFSFEERMDAFHGRGADDLPEYKSEQWIETKRVPITQEIASLFISWSDKLQEFITEHSLKGWALVFCYFQSSYRQPYTYGRDSLHPMTNTQPKEIFEACTEWIKQNKQTENPRLQEIRQRLTELETEQSQLERERDQIIRPSSDEWNEREARRERFHMVREALGFESIPGIRRYSIIYTLYDAGLHSRQDVEEWLKTQPFKIKGISSKTVKAIQYGLKRLDQQKQVYKYMDDIRDGINPIPEGTLLYINEEAQKKMLHGIYGYCRAYVTQDTPSQPEMIEARVEVHSYHSEECDEKHLSIPIQSIYGFSDPDASDDTSDLAERLFPIGKL